MGTRVDLQTPAVKADRWPSATVVGEGSKIFLQKDRVLLCKIGNSAAYLMYIYKKCGSDIAAPQIKLPLATSVSPISTISATRISVQLPAGVMRKQ